MNVRISEPAQLEADEMDQWWRANRPASPDLFARELAEARELLVRSPEVGPPYVERPGSLVRRVLLRRTTNHVYYEVDRDAGVVMIVAVWGAPKGTGPDV